MYKNICLSIFLLLTVFSYAQKSTLLKNVNYRAKELNHSLSKNQDSLILSDTRLIYKVDIFNNDFEKTINIADFKAKIPLHDIPVGRYVVDATLVDKHIIMTLIRNENFEEALIKTKQVIAKDSLTSITDLKPIDKKPYIDRHAQLLSKRPRKATHKVEKYFWVKYSINNGNTSYETMQLESEDNVERLILKHKLEIKTLNGRYNELTIWEVNDRTKFMEQQVTDPDYINSSVSDFFNVSPYYTSKKDLLSP